jgi:hypothetical protein
MGKSSSSRSRPDHWLVDLTSVLGGHGPRFQSGHWVGCGLNFLIQNPTQYSETISTWENTQPDASVKWAQAKKNLARVFFIIHRRKGTANNRYHIFVSHFGDLAKNTYRCSIYAVGCSLMKQKSNHFAFLCLQRSTKHKNLNSDFTLLVLTEIMTGIVSW